MNEWKVRKKDRKNGIKRKVLTIKTVCLLVAGHHECGKAVIDSGWGGEPDVCGRPALHGPHDIPQHAVVRSAADSAGTLLPLAGTALKDQYRTNVTYCMSHRTTCVPPISHPNYLCPTNISPEIPVTPISPQTYLCSTKTTCLSITTTVQPKPILTVCHSSPLSLFFSDIVI